MKDTTTLCRMRTVNQCFKEIKSLDPNTCISKRYLYKLTHEGLVKCFKSGTKYYIDFDDLVAFINGVFQPTAQSQFLAVS